MPIDGSSSGHHQAPLNEGSHRESNADVNNFTTKIPKTWIPGIQNVPFYMRRQKVHNICSLFSFLSISCCTLCSIAWVLPRKRRLKRCLSCAWTFFFIFFVVLFSCVVIRSRRLGEKRICQLLASFSFMMLVASCWTLVICCRLGRSVYVGRTDLFNLIFKTIIINLFNKLGPLIVV